MSVREAGHLYLQLHDQVVVSGALIDVLQGHDVFMLDPGESKVTVKGRQVSHLDKGC